MCRDVPNELNHAPTYGPGNGWNVGWGDAGITCPWRLWRTYGDTRVMREHYAAMQRFLAFLATREKDGLYTGRVGNGDWLNLGGGAAGEVIGTAYAAYDFQLTAEMAQAIGKEQDAAAYREQADGISKAFAAAYIDGEGRIKNSSQTAYALAFTMGLVPGEARQRMADQYAREIAGFDGHLATGFIGTPRLLPGLHLAARDDLAYRLLLREDYPSWLFEVRNGATTTWERWNGWTPRRGFAADGMNSFNHYAFGSVGEYLYGVVGGIQPDAPGYKRISIAPVVGDGLTWARAEYDSIQGRIVSAWKVADGVLTLDATVPPNTTATARVPAQAAAAVTEGGVPAATAVGVKLLRLEDVAAVYEVGSGSYHFQVEYLPRIDNGNKADVAPAAGAKSFVFR